MVTTLLLHVTLALPPVPAVPAAVVHAAVAEAADVWAPYGVAIDAAGPCGWTPDDSVLLTVVPVVVAAGTNRSLNTPAWRGALGQITFAPGGAPAPTITVFVTDIEQFIAAARVLGASRWAWPPALRDQVFGRVLGRVLAHEIGHYVLRSPRHAAAGLMRPVQLADDLVSPSRNRFTLTAADAARLVVRND